MSAGTDLVVSVIYPPMTVNGGTFTGAITCPTPLLVTGAAGAVRDLQLASSSSLRWIVRADATAEGGSNAGSDLQLLARDDTGAALFSNVITAKRSTGIVGLNIAAASLNTGNQNQLQVGGGIISRGAGNLTGVAWTDRTTATQAWTWYSDNGAAFLFFTSNIFTVESSGKFGYPTGQGGTVTQATSKSTGVTLNKLSGDITLNAAALAASTNVTFVLTNSTIAAADMVLVQHSSGGTTGAYQAWASGMAAGSCSITVRNATGGSLSEAAVIRYNVIKAAST